MSNTRASQGLMSILLILACTSIGVLATWPTATTAQAPQPTRRSVAVYQFNSGLPDVPGPTVREMFITALVQTGFFTVMQPNQPGTELIIDAVINESNLAQVKVKPELNDLLKGLLTGDVRPLSLDVRVIDARNGAILDIVQVTGKDMKNTKINLADFGAVLLADDELLDGRTLPWASRDA